MKRRLNCKHRFLLQRVDSIVIARQSSRNREIKSNEFRNMKTPAISFDLFPPFPSFETKGLDKLEFFVLYGNRQTGYVCENTWTRSEPICFALELIQHTVLYFGYFIYFSFLFFFFLVLTRRARCVYFCAFKFPKQSSGQSNLTPWLLNFIFNITEITRALLAKMPLSFTKIQSLTKVFVRNFYIYTRRWEKNNL